MEYRIHIMPRALRDLEGIHTHIAKDSTAAADAMIQRILDGLETLKLFPNRMIVSVQQKGPREPVRRTVVNPYLVYFRIAEPKHLVEILHIRHGARKPLKRFTS